MVRRRMVCGLLAVCAFALTSASAQAALIVPEFSSYPTLPGGGTTFAKLYLDFDGDFTSTFGTFSPGTTVAYDIDGDPNDFSDAELANIQQIWSAVAEKYSPFKLNVTTKDPGNMNNNETMKIVIGGNGAWHPGQVGGVAPYQAFMAPGLPNLGFVFPGNLRNGDPGFVAEAAAHEAGHGFALKHQSLWSGSTKLLEYNPGNADLAPIMGVSYFSARGQWWLGSGPDGPTPLQDDLRLLSAIGTARPNFGYRQDDHPNVSSAADPLAVEPDFDISARGVIELVSDVDFFSFTTPGGVAEIRADVNADRPMLDLSLRVYDSAGTEVGSRVTSSLGEFLKVELLPGSYSIGISSAAQNYGDIGQYFISGNVVPEPTGAGGIALLAIFARRRRH